MAMTSHVIHEEGPLKLMETTISTPVERYGRQIGETKDTVYDVWCDECDEFPAQAVNRREAQDEFTTHKHKEAE